MSIMRAGGGPRVDGARRAAHDTKVAEISERTLIDEVVRRLIGKYANVPASQISAAVQRAHARFERCPIRDFVPLLVERRVRQELSGSTELATASS
jgi:hypothetical protein